MATPAVTTRPPMGAGSAAGHDPFAEIEAQDSLLQRAGAGGGRAAVGGRSGGGSGSGSGRGGGSDPFADLLSSGRGSGPRR